jgi:uncharacterized membrane protein
MHAHHRKLTVLTLLLIAGTTAAGLVVWPRLPAEIATQFSARGTPTTVVSKPVGVFLTPAIMALVVLVLRAGFRVDPPGDPRVVTVTELSTVCLLSAVHLLVLAWNLGYPVPIDPVFVGILVWTAALVGYVLIRERVISVS